MLESMLSAQLTSLIVSQPARIFQGVSVFERHEMADLLALAYIPDGLAPVPIKYNVIPKLEGEDLASFFTHSLRL